MSPRTLLLPLLKGSPASAPLPSLGHFYMPQQPDEKNCLSFLHPLSHGPTNKPERSPQPFL